MSRMTTFNYEELTKPLICNNSIKVGSAEYYDSNGKLTTKGEYIDNHKIKHPVDPKIEEMAKKHHDDMVNKRGSFSDTKRYKTIEIEGQRVPALDFDAPLAEIEKSEEDNEPIAIGVNALKNVNISIVYDENEIKLKISYKDKENYSIGNTRIGGEINMSAYDMVRDMMLEDIYVDSGIIAKG